MSILLKWLIRTLICFSLLALVMAIVSYNLASRSLPNYNQSLVSGEITDQVEIIRDSSNIPHIFSGIYNPVNHSVDSIKRTVHLAFHGLFSLLKILFTISKQYF